MKQYNPILYTFLATWFASALFFIFTTGLRGLILGACIMWIPGIFALVFARKEGIHLRMFSKPKMIYFLAPILALSVIILSVLIALPIQSWSMKESPFILVGGYIAAISINMFFAMGEELMWRGYLIEKLGHLSYWKRQLCVGSAWGLWHAPLILFGHNYAGYPILGLIMMWVFCMVACPLHEWWLRRGGSIMYPAAFHGSINAFAGLTIMGYTDFNPLLVGAGLSTVVALALVTLALGRFVFFTHPESETS